MTLGILMTVLIISFSVALLIAVVVVLVRLTESARHREGEDLLKEIRDRYAKQETEKEEKQEQEEK